MDAGTVGRGQRPGAGTYPRIRSGAVLGGGPGGTPAAAAAGTRGTVKDAVSARGASGAVATATGLQSGLPATDTARGGRVGEVGRNTPDVARTPGAEGGNRVRVGAHGSKQGNGPQKGGRAVVLLRQEIGDVLRDARRQQGRTLREVSSMARVSLGYLSEVERGQKEASSELIASICGALEMPLSSVMREVTERVAAAEGLPSVPEVQVPDTVPDGLADGLVSAA